MYSHIFVAGTFDGLHKGHEALLRKAFEVGGKVTVGLTTNDFVAKYKVQQFSPDGRKYADYIDRLNNLKNWMNSNYGSVPSEIVEINDPYEPLASSPNFDALIVTSDNRHRGEEINRIRKTRNLAQLTLVEVPLLTAEDGLPISASRVKNGEITPGGKLVMPDALRPELGKPMGILIKNSDIKKALDKRRRHLVITVGDMTTKNIISAGRTPALSIIDLQVERHPYHELDEHVALSGSDVVHVKSGPGFISHEAIDEIKLWSAQVTSEVVKQRIIVVTGEEDLLTLPVVAYCPLGTVVYYGQPGQGVVEVEVTREKKEEAVELLAKFS